MSEDISKENERPLTTALPIKDYPALKGLCEALSEEQQGSLLLTNKEAEYLKKVMDTQVVIGDQAALPMVCLGPKCPVAMTCPLQQLGKAPLGNTCPIELSLMGIWRNQYVSSLRADWEDKVERQTVMDLVEADILQSRTNGIIAAEGFIMENCVGISESGQALYHKEKHIALDVKDMIHKRKERLLKSLLVTREMKKKLGENSKDPAKAQSELLERLRKAKDADAKESK